MTLVTQETELYRCYTEMRQRIREGLLNETLAVQTLRDLASMRTTGSPEWHEPPVVLKLVFQTFRREFGNQSLQLPEVPFVELAPGEVLMPAAYLNRGWAPATEQRNLVTWCRFLEKVCERNGMRFEPVDPSIFEHVSVPGRQPGVKWGIFRLGREYDPRGRTMTNLWPKLSTGSLAGLEMLMALCFFPGLLVEEWNYIYLGAYRFKADDREWTLRLEKSRDGKKLYLQKVSSSSYMFDVILPQFSPLS